MPGFAPSSLAVAAAPRVRRRERRRVTLADGASTTLYVASYDAARVEPRIVCLPRPAPLAGWCRSAGVGDAMVGGFFERPHGMPLGELWIDGVRQRSTAFDSPWSQVRACVHVNGDGVQIAGRGDVSTTGTSDLLQAGPLLVDAGRTVVADGVDAEGFAAAAHQFDSDITLGRYPRAGLGLGGGRLIAVVCDGRAADEAGLTLRELADVFVALGATSAINLDGGGSASLVCDGELQNRPREDHGLVLAGGRPVSTALVFEPLA